MVEALSVNPLPEYKNLPDILDKFGNFFDNKKKT
jgi:hypothetical protein